MPKEKKKETLTVVIDLDILDYIKTKAEKTGNKSTVVNNMLRWYMDNEETISEKEALFYLYKISTEAIQIYNKLNPDNKIGTKKKNN